MSDLDKYRSEIDNVDREIAKLFEKRMDMVLKIADYKKKNNLQVFHKNREDEVIKKAISNINNKEYSEEVTKFFISMMEISKGKQKKVLSEEKELYFKFKRKEIDKSKRIGYPGVVGSFTEEAAIKFFGEESNRKAYDEFEDVFKALKNDEIDYGIVPIENSSTGAISANLDFLRNYGFYVVGEECIKIEQNLVGIKGTKLEEVKEVYSHIQGLQQSSEFLKKHSCWKLIPFHNTATSAKFVEDSRDNSKVAIASKRAAKLYNLEVLKERINNESDNSTRFVIVSKELNVVHDADKISVVFSLENEVGTLYGLIRHFADNNINMIKIESRPMKGITWRYFLYIDFEGCIESSKVVNALKLIQKSSSYFELLGAYKKKIH
ncbi:MAG: prephenate dehydratase [Clostridium sp.]|nr:prephenate dehydratase [Clostridium sp.]